jgi:hypothetical protein
MEFWASYNAYIRGQDGHIRGGLPIIAENEEKAQEAAESAVFGKFPNKNISYVIVTKLEEVTNCLEENIDTEK